MRSSALRSSSPWAPSEAHLRLLAGFAGGLADHPAQARHQRIERQHARTHEAFLQLRAYSRLLQQQGLVLACQLVHRAVQALQVGGRFAQRARKLLQGAEAVELQRIERFLTLVTGTLVARDDLRFGLRVQSPQLVAQAQVGLFHFRGGIAERTQLLLQARAIDRHLARVVDQAVKQVGADAHLLLRRAHADVVVVAQPASDDRGRQGLELDRPRRRGRKAPVGVGIHLFDRRHGRFGARGEFLDQPDRQADRAAGGHAGDHAVQAIEAALEQRHAVGAELRTLGNHRLQQRFHGMAELANGQDAGHARATLQCVQVALQADQRFLVVRLLAQLREQAIGVVEQVAAFLDEDVDELHVERGDVERLVRIVRGRGG